MSSDSMQDVADGGPGPDVPPELQDADIAASVQATEANLHETLLEGVSAQAIAVHGEGEPALLPPAILPPAEAAEPEAVASEPAPLVEDLTVVPDDAAEPVPFAPEAVEAATTTVDTVAEAIAVPAALADTGAADERPAAAAPSGTGYPGLLSGLRPFAQRAGSPRIGQVMGELGAVNATVLTYLRGEGTAAVAHWQALSGAKTPAEALRIQVDEMQRAADASLSCFAALAKRAGRFTALIGRP